MFYYLRHSASNYFKVFNACSIPYPNLTFNCIITQAFWTTIITKHERYKIIKEINRVLKKGGVLYIADFGQTWHLPIYQKLYKEGIKKGYEEGTFEAINKEGEVDYLAHHFTKKEFICLLFTRTSNFVWGRRIAKTAIF